MSSLTYEYTVLYTHTYSSEHCFKNPHSTLG